MIGNVLAVATFIPVEWKNMHPKIGYKTLSGATSKAKRVWEAKQFSNCACHMGRGRRHAPACTFKQFRDYLFVPTPVT